MKKIQFLFHECTQDEAKKWFFLHKDIGERRGRAGLNYYNKGLREGGRDKQANLEGAILECREIHTTELDAFQAFPFLQIEIFQRIIAHH